MKFSYTISIFAVIFIILVILQVSVIARNTYYIGQTGRDSNNGSIDSPWASLKHAIKVAGPGDTILMRGGVYATNEVWIKGESGSGGANGQYLTIKNYPGETVSVGGERLIIIDHADYVRIEGLHIRMPYRIAINGQGIQIKNNIFSGQQPSYGAIELRGSDAIIEGNRIEISGGSSTRSHGIYLHAGSNNIIRNNFISGASGYCLHIYDEDKGDHSLKYYQNVLIENNTLAGSIERSGMLLGAHDNTVEMDGIVIRNNLIINNHNAAMLIKYEPIKKIEIYNNVIYGNDYGIRVSAEIDDFRIQNNIFCSNNQIHIEISGNIRNAAISHNLYHQSSVIGNGVTDSNPIYGNPLFVNAAGVDFQLRENSPAIDAGVDVGLPHTGNKPDLGAFEYDLASSTIEKTTDRPQKFNLQQNYQNPLTPSTEICYKIPYTVDIDLSIYDISEWIIKTLIKEKLSDEMAKIATGLPQMRDFIL